jgi:hypothetical protein
MSSKRGSGYLGYQVNPDASASLSVENLFNTPYSRYPDVAPSAGHGANSTPLPSFGAGITIKGAHHALRRPDAAWRMIGGKPNCIVLALCANLGRIAVVARSGRGDLRRGRCLGMRRRTRP